MRTTIKEVEEDTVINANFSAMAFEVGYANKLAKALQSNKRVKTLDISMSNLTDDNFLPLAKALLARSTSLVELNVECNNLSTRGVDELIKLIVNEKVGKIFIYKNNQINSQDKKKLFDIAKNHTVAIDEKNPIERTDPKAYARLLAQSEPTSYESLLAASKSLSEEKEQLNSPRLHKR